MTRDPYAGILPHDCPIDIGMKAAAMNRWFSAHIKAGHNSAYSLVVTTRNIHQKLLVLNALAHSFYDLVAPGIDN